MGKTKKVAAEPRGARPPWADQAIPVAGVPSGVRAVRDDRGRLVEIIVPFWAQREVKGSAAPMGHEAVHLIALSAVDYVNALVQLLRASPVANEDRHVNTLLRTLASLEGALFEMDRSAFAAVGEAPRRADGQRVLSAHDAVLDVVGWSVTWALRALKNLEQDNGTPLEFFTRLDPERFRGAADVVARLRAVVDQLDPRVEIADWASAKVLLSREVAQLRTIIEQRSQPPPGGEGRCKDIARACIDGDAKGLRKWPDVRRACGIPDKDTTPGVDQDFRRLGSEMLREEVGHLERTPDGFIRTTAKGVAHFGL